MIYEESIMKMDEYELDLLDAIETAEQFQRVENFEDELLQAQIINP